MTAEQLALIPVCALLCRRGDPGCECQRQACLDDAVSWDDRDAEAELYGDLDDYGFGSVDDDEVEVWRGEPYYGRRIETVPISIDDWQD